MLAKLQKSEFVAFVLASFLAPLAAILATKFGLSESLVSQIFLGLLGAGGFYGAQRAYAKPREMAVGPLAPPPAPGL